MQNGRHFPPLILLYDGFSKIDRVKCVYSLRGQLESGPGGHMYTSTALGGRFHIIYFYIALGGTLPWGALPWGASFLCNIDPGGTLPWGGHCPGGRASFVILALGSSLPWERATYLTLRNHFHCYYPWGY